MAILDWVERQVYTGTSLFRRNVMEPLVLDTEDSLIARGWDYSFGALFDWIGSALRDDYQPMFARDERSDTRVIRAGARREGVRGSADDILISGAQLSPYAGSRIYNSLQGMENFDLRDGATAAEIQRVQNHSTTVVLANLIASIEEGATKGQTIDLRKLDIRQDAFNRNAHLLGQHADQAVVDGVLDRDEITKITRDPEFRAARSLLTDIANAGSRSATDVREASAPRTTPAVETDRLEAWAARNSGESRG